MRILYYSSHPNLSLNAPTGYGTHIREMIAAFRLLGHEVKPLIMGGEERNIVVNEKTHSSSLKSLAKKILPAYVWGSLRDFQRLRFDEYARQQLEMLCESFQPDLIYERASYLQNSGISTAKKYKIPHILEQNAPLIDEQLNFFGKSFFVKKALNIEEQLIRQTNKVCVVSSILRDHFCKKYNLPTSHFLVTPNAINLSKVVLDNEKIEQLRDKWKLQDCQVIGFVGSIFPWHGVDLLIQAFAKISDSFPKAKVLIVGDGATLPKLKDLAKSLNLEGNVIFAGSFPPEEVFNCMALMDITVMAKSNWYGSPVKIFEYGAMKKAIIGPNKAPVREVLEHGKHGLIVDASVKELKNAYKLLLEDISLREELAQRFYDKVVSHHTWEQMASKILTISHNQTS